MNEQNRSIALVVAGLLFVAFLLAKLLIRPSRRGPLTRPERLRLAEDARRARDGALSPAERAAALRKAATTALELERPRLAATYARRAERLEPGNTESVNLIARALRRASRFRALESMLWRNLAETESDPASSQGALFELIELYAGPLKRPEIAAALRRIGHEGGSKK
jgi:hypothetical protein